MIRAEITDIRNLGWTYEVDTMISEGDVTAIFCTFNTTHPTADELQYHIIKQWEMHERCRQEASLYSESYKTLIGKKYLINQKV